MPPGIKFNTNLITTIKSPKICHKLPISDYTQLMNVVKLNVSIRKMTLGDEVHGHDVQLCIIKQL